MISKILQEISSDFNHILMKNDISLIVEDNSRLMLVHDDGEKYKFMDIALGENSQIEELEKDNTALRFLLAGTSNWNAIETAPKDGSEIWSYNGEQGRMKFVSGDGYSLARVHQ